MSWGFRSIFPRYAYILGNKNYPIVFSLLYALIGMFNYYPGIMEEDSLSRWGLARHIAYHGFSNLNAFTNHHPVVPSILQVPFYWLTGEIGFFAFIQSFSISFLLFYFVRSYHKGWLSNLITSLFMFFPINYIMSIAHTFDTIFAVFLLLFLILLPAWYSNGATVWKLVVVFFIMVSARLNAFALLIPLLAYLFISGRSNSIPVKKRLITSLYFVLAASLPLIITKSLNFQDRHSWVIGVSWEYANLATKSKNPYHRDYLEDLDLGIDIELLSKNICYHNIWCGQEFHQLAKHAPLSREISQKILINYIKIALEEPLLFINEKRKYIGSLMGFGKKLGQAYVDMPRREVFNDHLASYGFVVNDRKNSVIDSFFSFNKNFPVQVFYRPWLLFLLSIFLLFFSYRNWGRAFCLRLVVPVAGSWFYYFTFFITAQNHEIRYFYPTLLVLQGCFIVFLTSRSTLGAKKIFFKRWSKNSEKASK